MMQYQNGPKQHSIFKLVSNNESNKQFELNSRQKYDNGEMILNKARETELHQQREQVMESERLSSLHEKLHKEADKIRKWKANTELEIKQKDRKIQEATTTIESLRKSILELQLENESLSLKLQEEMSNREDIQQRIIATREICTYLKEHSLTTDAVLRKCKEEKEELQLQQEDYLLKFKELSDNFRSLEICSTREKEELMGELKAEKETRGQSTKEWSAKIKEMETKLKELVDQCDEKDIEIRDIRTELNRNEDKMHEFKNVIDCLQSQLSSAQENLQQTESRLLQSEENLSTSKADYGQLERKLAEMTDSFMEKCTSEQNLKEELEDLKERQEADVKVMQEEISSLKEIISKDKERINELEAIVERTQTTVEELKSSKDILIMEKSEMESKIIELVEEKSRLQESHTMELQRAEQLYEHLYKVNKELDSSRTQTDQQKELVSQLSEDYAKLKIEKADLDREMSRVTSLLEEKCSELSKMKQEMCEMENLKCQLSSKVADLESRGKDSSMKFQQVYGELQEAKSQIVDMQSELQRYNVTIEELQDQLKFDTQTREKLDTVLKAEQEAREKIDELQRELDEQIQENEELKTAQEEQDKTIHGELESKSKEREKLETKLKSLKDDISSKNKQIKELEKEMRSMKSKITTLNKASDSKDAEIGGLKEAKEEVLLERNSVLEENAALKNELSKEQASAAQAAKLVKEMRRDYEKMERQLETSNQSCEYQIKEMTDTLAKYQQENAKVVNQRDKEIDTLKQTIKQMEVSVATEGDIVHKKLQTEIEVLKKEIYCLKINVKELEHEKEELVRDAQLTVATYEEEGNVKVRELEELQRKFAKVTTKDVVSTCIQTSPIKDLTGQSTPKAKQSNTKFTPKTPKETKAVDNNSHLSKDPPARNLPQTTPNMMQTPKLHSSPKTPNRPSAYVTPSRSTLKTPQRSILRPSCSTSVIKKRRVAFASDGDSPSDAESSSSEMMEVEIEEVNSRYKDGKQSKHSTPLLLRPSPKMTPNLYDDFYDDDDEKENWKKRTPKSKGKLALNRVPRAPPVQRKTEVAKSQELKEKEEFSLNGNSENKAQNIRKAPAKQQGKFFKSSPKERSQKSKMSAYRKQREESWFDLDSVFGFED